MRRVQKTDEFEYHVTEHLRVSGAYWGLAAMEVLGCGAEIKRSEMIEWLQRCQHPSGELGNAARLLNQDSAYPSWSGKVVSAERSTTTPIYCTPHRGRWRALASASPAAQVHAIGSANTGNARCT